MTARAGADASAAVDATGAVDLLLIDDDPVFGRTVARALGRRGLTVHVATQPPEALVHARRHPVDYCVVDLRLGDALGIDLIKPLRRALPEARIVMLTGYASIPTAVHAMKAGADDYLSKPVTAGELWQRLRADEAPAGTPDEPPAARPMTLRRLEWEHIQRVLADHRGNISAAAAALGLHRRTLQRKLGKRPARR